MDAQAREIRKPALLGLVAATAMIAALAASWSLAARAEAMRPGWGDKAVLFLLKGPPDTDSAYAEPSDTNL